MEWSGRTSVPKDVRCFSSSHLLQQQQSLFGERHSIPRRLFAILTGIVVFVPTVIAICIPNLEFILALTGATSGQLICYILPAIITLHLTPNGEDRIKTKVTIASLSRASIRCSALGLDDIGRGLVGHLHDHDIQKWTGTKRQCVRSSNASLRDAPIALFSSVVGVDWNGQSRADQEQSGMKDRLTDSPDRSSSLLERINQQLVSPVVQRAKRTKADGKLFVSFVFSTKSLLDFWIRNLLSSKSIKINILSTRRFSWLIFALT